MNNVEGPKFQFIPPTELKGLTPELVNDLSDILYKWGRIDLEEHTVRFGHQVEPDFQILMSGPLYSDSAPLNMLVYKTSIPKKGVHVIETENDQGMILWDKELTVEEAKLATVKIDATGFEAGLIDTQSGERKPTPLDAAVVKEGEKPKLKVAEFFSQRGSVMSTFDKDPEELLREFDEPERLTVLVSPAGIMSICSKEDVPYFEARERIVGEILNEMGIDMSNLEDMDKLTIEKILKLREEVALRLEKEFPEEQS